MKKQFVTRYKNNPILTKDRRELLIKWNNKFLKDFKGTTIGVVSMGQDITERKLFEVDTLISR